METTDFGVGLEIQSQPFLSVFVHIIKCISLNSSWELMNKNEWNECGISIKQKSASIKEIFVKAYTDINFFVENG